MFDIGNYLEKFKKFSQSRDFLRDSVASAIQEACKIEIDSKKIEVKEGIARISERPIIKSEIFLKKAKILAILKEKGFSNIFDIL
jgi:hypothetical protein